MVNSARVTSVSHVGTATVAIELETPDEFDALPGQFVLFRADIDGESETGYYTISSPVIDSRFEVTVGIDPDSDFSAWLAERTAGDTIDIDGPYGNVSYDDEGDVLTIAGGPGVGPALAIAERADRHGHQATVIYQDDDHAHEQRLDALSEGGHDVYLFSPEETDQLGDAIEDHIAQSMAYVFGFADFCSTVQDVIEDVANEPYELHVESFG